jgi:hypothetical protein
MIFIPFWIYIYIYIYIGLNASIICKLENNNLINMIYKNNLLKLKGSEFSFLHGQYRRYRRRLTLNRAVEMSESWVLLLMAAHRAPEKIPDDH